MTDFRTLPDGPLRLTNLTVPRCVIGHRADLVRIDLSIDGDTFAEAGGNVVDMEGAFAFPAFVDMHTHLDKGHIWPRSPNQDGTFESAILATRADSGMRWTADDLSARMTFSLECAYAHGTRAIRTHLDSNAPLDETTWPVFDEIRAEWAGRITLQASCLVGCDRVASGPDGARFVETADRVAAAGGVLGMVTYPMGDLRARLRTFLELAAARGLDADFHCDETLDPNVETLRDIAEVVREVGFAGNVTVGHCCSLVTQDEARALDTLDLVAAAGLNVVSLPMCNLYLQDRHVGRTPRYRGITLVHEMQARGIPVAFASDNTRDPFYAYGDMDMIEVMREATRIGHLDHSTFEWTRSFNSVPASICGFPVPGFEPGAPADLILCRARTWTELFARPQSDRIVIRNGRVIDRTLPDFARLDPLMSGPEVTVAQAVASPVYGATTRQTTMEPE